MPFNHLSGKAIQEGLGPNLGKLVGIGFGTEIFYSFIIIICSLMIYFGTKELYELSSHNGIKYFRKSFLFFALAYFFRSFIKFFLVYFNLGRVLDLQFKFFHLGLGKITLFTFMYFSSMAIFYLLYSVINRLNKNSEKLIIFHLLALIIAILSVIFRDPTIYLSLNIFLFFFVVLITYISYKNPKKKSKKENIYIIYFLLLSFWILNILDILIPNFLQTFQLFIYLASSGVFLSILYKVLTKLNTN
jgi:hypothetical protein